MNSFSINSANRELTSLNDLPTEILQEIVVLLPNVTGSEGVLNEKDIPVAMRFMQNLALTNKRMNDIVHQPSTTKLFICEIAKKYQGVPEHFAAQLNTVAARVFLWDYVQKNKLDEAYSVIQNIYSLASSVLLEAKDEGLDFNLSEGREGWPTPNPYYFQTQTGFFLYCDWAPSHLATPFGEIKIYGGGSCSGNAPLSVSEIFIHHLNATFESLPMGFLGKREGSQITRPSMASQKIRKIDRSELLKINEQDLENAKGSQNLIVNSYCGNCSVYKIQQVCGKTLPEPTHHTSRESLRSYELINVIWEMLGRNRLGKDPVSKDIKPKDIDQKSKEEVEPLFRNICEMGYWGVDLISKLSQQPLFQGQSIFDTPSKVLVLESYREARALELLNDAASIFLEKNTAWMVDSFGCGNHRLTLNGQDIGEGVQLLLKGNACSLETLIEAYNKVTESVSQGWEFSNLRNYPDILHLESEEDYFLLIKKTSVIPQEDILIRFLADQLGISKLIRCNDAWKGETLNNSDRPKKPKYLWIRKDGFKEVVNMLRLDLSLVHS